MQFILLFVLTLFRIHTLVLEWVAVISSDYRFHSSDFLAIFEYFIIQLNVFLKNRDSKEFKHKK